MATQFWSEVSSAVIGGLVGAGAVGGVFWIVLGKGIEARVTKLLDTYRKVLAAQLHKEKTVYSRMDQQRADALQKLNAQIHAHRWEVIDFSPKFTFRVGPDRTDAKSDAIAWCFQQQIAAKRALQISLESSLLLTKDLVANVFTWYQTSNELTTDLVLVFGDASRSEAYANADDDRRRELLREQKDKLMAGRSSYYEATNRLLEELRVVFTAVEVPQPSGG